MKTIQTNELEALQNAANLINATVMVEHYYQDSRKKPKYYLVYNGCSESPVLDYVHLNEFIGGWIRCKRLSEQPLTDQDIIDKLERYGYEVTIKDSDDVIVENVYSKRFFSSLTACYNELFK